MTPRDLLIHLRSYPPGVADNAAMQAVEFCRREGAELTLHAVAAALPKGRSSAQSVLWLAELAAEEEARCRREAEELLDAAAASAKAVGVPVDRVFETAPPYEIPNMVARQARTHDLALLPVSGSGEDSVELAEALIFGSGRPVLLFDPDKAPLGPRSIETVLVAWDGSRCAARAVADALPLLRRARDIHVLTVLGENRAIDAGRAAGLVRHLSIHGLSSEPYEIEVGDKTIGDVFEREAAVFSADLLVMGAFGHSRLREFVLGGATRSMIRRPPCPVLLSH